MGQLRGDATPQRLKDELGPRSPPCRVMPELDWGEWVDAKQRKKSIDRATGEEIESYADVSNDFGTPGAAANSIFLDDRAAADRFRQSLVDHCLRVSRALSVNPDEDARVRVAVVGGATGVKLAAELRNAAAALGYYGLEVFDESRGTAPNRAAGTPLEVALARVPPGGGPVWRRNAG